MERITLGELLQRWTRAHGVKAKYVQVDKQVYDALWPGLGSEFVMGMEFWDWIKAKENWGEEDVLDWRDLDIDLSGMLGGPWAGPWALGFGSKPPTLRRSYIHLSLRMNKQSIATTSRQYALRRPLAAAPLCRWWRRNYSKIHSDSNVEVLYSKTKSHSESLARQFVNEPVLGFDMKWPWDAYIRPRLQDKAALIQLAKEGKVALFHISLHEGDTVADLITPTLKEIIESSKIKKAGVNVMSADFSRLRAYFNLEPKGAFELSHLYNLVTYGAVAPHLVTTKIRQLSMQAEEHLGLSLWKGRVRTSDWSQPLNQNQIQHAAIDAYACFMLFHRMNAKRLAMDPVPPLPRLAETYLHSATSKSSTLQLESSTEDGEVEVITATDFFGLMKDREQNGKITEGLLSIKQDDTDSESKIIDDMQGDVGDDVKDCKEASSEGKRESQLKHDDSEHNRNLAETEGHGSFSEFPTREAGSTSGEMAHDDILAELKKTKLTSFPSVTEYIDRCKELCFEIRSTGGIITDSELITFMIAGLPNTTQFNTLKSHLKWLRSSVGSLDLNFFLDQLANEEEAWLKAKKDKAARKSAGYNSLYCKLVSHRKELAKSQGVPAFLIASNSVLEDLALQRPSNEHELLLVPGIGVVKAAQFGPAWLEIISDFEREQVREDDHDEQKEVGESISVSLSEEISTLSKEPPTVLSPGLSFQLGETSLTKASSVLSQPREQDNSSDEDSSVFGPLMELPSPSALKRKRDVAVPSDLERQLNLPQDATRIAASLPASISVSTYPPVPIPASTVGRQHLQTPPRRFGLAESLRNKLEAYINGVVWAMQLKPSDPLISEDMLHYSVNAVPQTIEEFRRAQRLMKTCETVRMDIRRTIEKRTQDDRSGSR
ncbi:hypothetical protein FHL15_010326 [Xylaria flabelliformis]|uniref:HRDC domain-containing protein n=1 Tax=Xylaria flabelliformis TaxID=2512241 RepID=A0A553HLH1_9PEZI|nr:hypothetical protein FHL15_010326 [Xylaria flabelliformis]